MTLRDCFGGLAERRLFVIYQLRPKSGGRAGTDKVPVGPFTEPWPWMDVDCHQPAARMTLGEAQMLCPQDGRHGVGFVLTDDVPAFFLDLDHALVDGAWASYVQPVLDAFPGAYVETSSSGDGIHVIGLRGERPLHRTRCKEMRAELYTGGRFCALTGNHARGSAESDHTAALGWLLQWFPAGEQIDAEGWSTEPQPGYGIADDERLIDVACRAVSARAIFGGGISFRQMWDGDVDALGKAFPAQTHGQGYDASAADLAMLNHLAFYTGGNCEQMERLLRRSGLSRDKHERDSYMHASVLRACAGRTSWYADRSLATGASITHNPGGTPSVTASHPDLVNAAPVPVLGIAPAPAGAIATASGSASQSAALAAPAGASPSASHIVTYDRQGRVEASLGNLGALLRGGHAGQIRYDTFTDQIILNGFPLTDDAISQIRMDFEALRVAPPAKDTMRDAIDRVARVNAYDSAIEWVTAQAWDGVPRIDTALATYFGVDDTEYTRAVSAYMFTGIAGRVLSPGCQADMVPVLTGAQGLRKSSAIAALAPFPEYFTEIQLGEKEADLARKMRGKVLGEIAELQGLKSRDLQSIRAFITTRRDKWVPKFKEYSTMGDRRLLLIGTANEHRYLDDETGERRWLPMTCTHTCDPEGVERDRAQLWAEGAARYRANGIEWQRAERLAPNEHGGYKVGDPWHERIAAWVNEPGVPKAQFTVADVLGDGLGMNVRDMTRTEENRAAKILRALGFVNRQVSEGGTRRWRWLRTAQ